MYGWVVVGSAFTLMLVGFSAAYSFAAFFGAFQAEFGASRGDIALVFSDIMLPGGLLGSQLVQKLCERRPGLKVLLTSAFSESTIMQRGVLDGSIELLQKPYKVEDLARRIRAKLDGKEENQRVPA